jgi:hypothetical protein
MEIWKDVPNYNGDYQVSNLGNVRSLKYNKVKILKQNFNGKGYLQVSLSINGKNLVDRIHKLVAVAFLNHKPNGTMKIVIDHINNIKSDNRVENLQLTSNRHNATKDKKNGTSKYIGVCWCKNKKKWIAQIRINDKHKNLGYFICELAAASAYQKELKQYTYNK